MEIVLAYGRELDMLKLVTEYTNGILEQGPDVVQCLNSQHLDDELKDMNLKYALPHGRMYLALVEDKAVGCVALTKNDDMYKKTARENWLISQSIHHSLKDNSFSLIVVVTKNYIHSISKAILDERFLGISAACFKNFHFSGPPLLTLSNTAVRFRLM